MAARRYTLTSSAEADIADIIRYTLERWSVEQARKYVDKLECAFSDLARGKIKGTPCDEIHPGALKLFVERHIVFYMHAPKKCIHILRVLHVRMDIPTHFS